MPIPQELFFLWDGPKSPSNKFMKRTFARGLLYQLEKVGTGQCCVPGCS